MKIKTRIIGCIIALHCSSAMAMQHPLIQAIQDKNINQVKAALVNYVPNFYSETENCTPLSLACALGNGEIINTLLDAKADIDFQFKDEEDKPKNHTALTVAARHGHAEICRLLIERGANTNPQNPENFTPLHAAAWSGNAEITKMLIAHGAKIDVHDATGVTPLHRALFADANNNHYRAFAHLLIAGANPDIRTRYNDQKTQTTHSDKTALMLAIMLNKKLFMHALLLFGASRDVPDRSNKIPTYIYRSRAHFERYDDE
jgi:ankyrin repeat protein